MDSQWCSGQRVKGAGRIYSVNKQDLQPATRSLTRYETGTLFAGMNQDFILEISEKIH